MRRVARHQLQRLLSVCVLTAFVSSACSDGYTVQPGPVAGSSAAALQVVNGTIRQAALAPYSSSPSITTTAGARTVQLAAAGR